MHGNESFKISKQAECFCGTQWLRIAGSKGSTRLGASMRDGGSRAGFRNVMFSLIYNIAEVQKRELYTIFKAL